MSRTVVFVLASLMASGMSSVWVEGASAQGAPAIVDPPTLQARQPAPRLTTLMSVQPKPLVAAAVAPSAPSPAEIRDIVYDLNVQYTEGKLWNPAENRFDTVKLRSYVGNGVNPETPFIGPRIDMYPGQTVRMTLHNKLPKDTTCPISGGSINIPHCFNGTNMHTHGLWINPSGNSDNVLISVNPGVDFQYEYNIPPDHPSGTFWYHSHRHGSTALQVSSGMVGALIVRGTRPPTTTANGDLDTLLKPIPSQPFTERVMVFEQIQYACRDPDTNKIETNPDGTYACKPTEVGGVEDYDQFGPGSWPKSGRFTSINGAVLGHLDNAQAGKVERWRMIHGGVRDTITLQFRKLAPNAKPPGKLLAAQAQAYVDTNCTGAPLTYHLVAADGLTKAAATKTNATVFQPGYRWDALVVFPEVGDYCIIDGGSSPSTSINETLRPTQILGTVHVSGGTPVTGDLTEYLRKQLDDAADANFRNDEKVRDKVKTELADGLKLTSFVPHKDIDAGEVNGTQTLTFNINVSQINGTFFQIDGQPYDGNRIDRTLRLGGTDEWTMKSDLASHPFHIHVNPFQVIKIIAPDGKTDVSEPGAIDNFAIDPKTKKPIIDPEYPGLKGVWKDTLFIKNAGGEKGQYTIVVRTRYERYIGDFVLHCHILDHEDQGMMQNVRIAVPDGEGGVTHGHH
jgi:FtsP/CotA-like multicopper oxidase with cupredoxin domain